MTNNNYRFYYVTLGYFAPNENGVPTRHDRVVVVNALGSGQIVKFFGDSYPDISVHGDWDVPSEKYADFDLNDDLGLPCMTPHDAAQSVRSQEIPEGESASPSAIM